MPGRHIAGQGDCPITGGQADLADSNRIDGNRRNLVFLKKAAESGPAELLYIRIKPWTETAAKQSLVEFYTERNLLLHFMEFIRIESTHKGRL